MEWVIVVFKDSPGSKVEHEVFADEVSFAYRELEQSLEQQVPNSSVNKIFLFPLELHKPLFRRHVKTQKSFEKLGPLHVLLEPVFVPKYPVILEKLKQYLEFPLIVILVSQNFGGFDLVVELGLVVIKIVFVVILL